MQTANGAASVLHPKPFPSYLSIIAPNGQELTAGTPSHRLDAQGPLIGTVRCQQAAVQGVEQNLVLQTRHVDMSQALSAVLQRPQPAALTAHRYLQVSAREEQCAARLVLYLQAGVPRCQHTAVRGPLNPCEILGVCVKVLPDKKRNDNLKTFP